MGAILEARDADIRRRVAMKVLRSGVQGSNSHVARFIQEAQVTGQLEHPGIVPVYELGVDRNDRAFYTMKLVRGMTLRQIAHARQQDESHRPQHRNCAGGPSQKKFRLMVHFRPERPR